MTTFTTYRLSSSIDSSNRSQKQSISATEVVQETLAQQADFTPRKRISGCAIRDRVGASIRRSSPPNPSYLAFLHPTGANVGGYERDCQGIEGRSKG